MLFHITSQHNWETCEGSREFKGENVPPHSGRQRWIEGNAKVKVIGAYGCQTQHRYYAIVEANDYMMFGRYLAVQDISEQAKWKSSLSMMVSLIEKPLESGGGSINDLV